VQQLSDFTKDLNPAKSSDSDRDQLCPPAVAAQRAGLLFGCYRKDDANDPDVYVAAVSAVLCDYSEAIVMAVTDPRTGIPRKSKWLPSIAEIAEVCDKWKALVLPNPHTDLPHPEDPYWEDRARKIAAFEESVKQATAWRKENFEK
jgi:hypothetical protein